MSFESLIRESIWGRRFGLSRLSSAVDGSTRSGKDWLAGPEGTRVNVSTAETTSVELHPFGLSNLSTVSSGVHTLNPPIPGIQKTIVCTGGATEYVKTRNSETLESSAGSTFTTMKWVGYGVAHLVGLTTARWLLHGWSSGTSSQGQNITLSTST